MYGLTELFGTIRTMESEKGTAQSRKESAVLGGSLYIRLPHERYLQQLIGNE